MTDSNADATDQQVAAPDQTDKQSLSVLLIGLDEYDLTLGREILPEHRVHVDKERIIYLSLEQFRKEKDGLTGLCGVILGDWDSPLEKRTIIDDWANKHKIRRCAVVPDFPEDPRGSKPQIRKAEWLQFQVGDMLRQVDTVRKIISDSRQRQGAEERTVRRQPPREPRWKIVYGQDDYGDLPADESNEEID